MTIKKSFVRIGFLISAVSIQAFGATPPNKMEREDMAKVHDEVATCLRSERPIQECHKIMSDFRGTHKMWRDNMNGPYGGRGKMMNNGATQTPAAGSKP